MECYNNPGRFVRYLEELRRDRLVRVEHDYTVCEDDVAYQQEDYNWDVPPSGKGRSHRTREESFELVNSCSHMRSLKRN